MADKDDRLILGVVLGAVAVWLWSMRCGFLGGAGAGQASAGAGTGTGGCAGCHALARPSYCPPRLNDTGNYQQGAGPALQGSPS